MKRTFVVIGLGAFGGTVARELARLGHDVLCIDSDAGRINDIADAVTQAVVADARDEKALRDLGVAEADAVVVAIGEDIEANILITLNVKNMYRPKVWAKALTHNHHRILQKLGADHIVHPEHDMGLRLAHALTYPEVADYINLGHDLFTVEVRASERLAGQKLAALELAQRKIRLLLVKRGREVLLPVPEDLEFAAGDQVVLLGALGDLRRISALL
ncbi:MAG: TrkA family potassium uptake protein [Burkholderiaceae bacterium]